MFCANGARAKIKGRQPPESRRPSLQSSLCSMLSESTVLEETGCQYSEKGAVRSGEENVLSFEPPFDISDLFEDFQCKTPVQLCAHCTQDRADSLSRPTLAADYFPKITLADAQLENCDRFAFNRSDLDLVGVVYE